MTTYTVFRDPAEPLGRGLSAYGAMDELLGTDDRNWRIEKDPEAAGWQLLTGRQSFRSGRMIPVRSDVGYSSATDYQEAADDIACKVIMAITCAARPWAWTEAHVMTDEDFDAMMRQIAEDNEDA
jgi:hypothetical protein